MEHFYLITNRPKDTGQKMTHRVREFLESHNKKCTLQLERSYAGNDSYTDPLEIPGDVDCIIVLGGDGTLLQAARDTMDTKLPLLGINLGTLGYLAEVESANLEPALQQLLNGSFEIEERMMLQGRIVRGDQIVEDTYAWNDIVLSRSGSLRIVSYNVHVNGQFLKDYHADGMIVSTPTGSTGYNMSAGGPIVEPKASLLLLTPICPHTLNARSIILSDQDLVTIDVLPGKVGEGSFVEVSFDGTRMVALKEGDKVLIQKSQNIVRLLKLSQVSFLEMLHKKMREA